MCYFRTSIPFLAYPTSYYTEISSSTYSWIPLTFTPNDIITLKLAKYSATGQFLGLVDAFDSYMQLCGGGYTDGRAAFTFGTSYKRSVSFFSRFKSDNELCRFSVIFEQMHCGVHHLMKQHSLIHVSFEY